MDKIIHFFARLAGSQVFAAFVLTAVAAPMCGSTSIRGHFGEFVLTCAIGAMFISTPVTILRSLRVKTTPCLLIVAPLATLLCMGTVATLTVPNPTDIFVAHVCQFFIILLPAWFVTLAACWGGELFKIALKQD